VHDVGEELSNLERQRESTHRIVNEIDRQIGGLSSQLDRNTAELILATDNLAERNAVLQRRLIDIYKRGQLYVYQVLLTVESFGDLVSRYKYLFLTSQQDRQLVSEVESLRNRIAAQRNNVLEVRTQLDRTKEEREAELKRYGTSSTSAPSGCRRSSGAPRTPTHSCPRWRRTRRGSPRCWPPRTSAARTRRRAPPPAAWRRRRDPSPRPTWASSTGRCRARSSTSSAATRCRAAG
jgi:hypothetical protein